MSRWAGAFRTKGIVRHRDILAAAVATACVPGALSLALMWLVPAGCDIRGDPALYRWTCLLPGMLVVTSIAAAVLLPLAFVLNRRLGRRMPDGWLPTILMTGVAAQILFALGYLMLLEPVYIRLFLSELILLPQPFVAGALSAGSFTAALRASRRWM